jgi:SAM-dependent methyltransferase
MKRNDKGLREHWERIYQEKGPQDVSWTQEVPRPSLNFIEELDLSPEARIIDVGGGDSSLVDHLLKEGYQDITVLDLSRKALEKAEVRLGEDARYVEWIASDVLDFEPSGSFDLWHDRATFHFLTDPEDVKRYRELVRNAVKGYMLIGTFSDQGPEKCSGLPVQRYDEEGIEDLFSQEFELLKTWREDHITPGGTSQNFLFAGFKRKKG